jgi:hypothetical protein
VNKLETVPVRPRRRWPARAALIGGLALAVLALIGLATLGRDRPHQQGAPPARSASAAPPSTAGPSSALPSAPASAKPTEATRVGLPPAQVVQTLLDEIGAGEHAGQIRADAALDLRNVLTDLQLNLAAGHPVDLGAQATLIRTKIIDRQRERAIDPGLATQILSTVEGLVAT